jgi:murein L,D-transpeptidase YcbB/YkuD
LTRILLGVLLILGVSGCATTQHKADGDQMQSRIVELEKKLEEKDSEIVDLQYEVKDLASRVESRTERTSPDLSAPVPMAPIAKISGDIIRVNIQPEDLQKALKGAGVYNGKIDGKIGSGTKAAIIEFQKSNGLTPDGVVGRKTWDLLKQHLNQ